MIHQILFWFGITFATLVFAVVVCDREPKQGALTLPITLILAAAVAKYLGM